MPLADRPLATKQTLQEIMITLNAVERRTRKGKTFHATPKQRLLAMEARQ